MANKITCTCGHSWNKSDSSKKDMRVCHVCGKDNTMKNGGWLDKFDAPQAQNGIEGTMGGLTDKGFNFNPAWGGAWRDGGILQPPMAGANQTVPMAQKGNRSPKSKVSKNPYKEVDASGANFFRDILPVPDNVAQMLAKVAYGDARMDNTSLDDEQKMILWDVIQNAIKRSGKTSGGTEYRDYGNVGYGTPEFFNESFNRGKGNVFSIAGNSIFNKGYRLASTIGRGRYWTDEKDPNIIYYTDVYDWNPSEKNFKGSSTYQVLRNTLRSGEDKSLNPEKNEPYRMNFKLDKRDVDKRKQLMKTFHSTDDERFITAPIGENGMSLPGSVGFTYARTAGAAPSEGPYAKKTLPSAQNGMEMSFYQHGLDWTPRNISRNGGWLDKFEEGGEVVKDNEGYWNPQNWGKPVEINSNKITMEGVLEPLLGVSDTGDTKMMYPGKNYTFNGTKVVEYPREHFRAEHGKSVNRADEYPLEKLDNLLNFTNYNKPKAKNGWLEKYK